MNPDTVQELAKRIFDLLDEYGIDCERFGMSIVVTRQYYETIKTNFSDRPSFDLGFVQKKIQEDSISLYEPIEHRGWSISLVSRTMLPPAPLEDENDLS